MPKIEVTTDVKGLREALCEAAALAVFLPINVSITPYTQQLQGLINELDKHRPLGPDGKHGNLHTETCGCEDKPHGPWCPKTVWGGDFTGWQEAYTCEHVKEENDEQP